MIRPRFTVICPAYNRSAPIAATIESVLKQTRETSNYLLALMVQQMIRTTSSPGSHAPTAV